jgi:hypothetical protein
VPTQQQRSPAILPFTLIPSPVLLVQIFEAFGLLAATQLGHSHVLLTTILVMDLACFAHQYIVLG